MIVTIVVVDATTTVEYRDVILVFTIEVFDSFYVKFIHAYNDLIPYSQSKQQFSPGGGVVIAAHGPAVVQYVKPLLQSHGYWESRGDLFHVSVSQVRCKPCGQRWLEAYAFEVQLNAVLVEALVLGGEVVGGGVVLVAIGLDEVLKVLGEVAEGPELVETGRLLDLAHGFS